MKPSEVFEAEGSSLHTAFMNTHPQHPPLKQHIADSLEKFDEKWDGCFSDQNGDYINPEVKDFLKQSQLQLIEVIRGEVEKLETYDYTIGEDMVSYVENADYIKRQDVLDLLTIKDK